MKAFPQLLSLHKHYNQDSYIAETIEGMDLRDYFAAKAMQGFILSGLDISTIQDDEIAKVSYDLADAMMKARNGNN